MSAKLICGHKREGDLHFLRGVPRCKIFKEFSPAEREEYFSLCEKKVSHHIDSFYYSCFLWADDTDTKKEEITFLLNRLEILKQKKLAYPSEELEYCGLDVMTSSFSIYQYHLQMPEEFDIFIAKNIPNADTPRICVQLRSRMLVLEGEDKAIKRSFAYVEQLLDIFNLKAWKVLENRIDFAYHTNLIQSISKYITVEKMKNKLISQARLFSLWGKVGKDIEIDTFSLGNRRSNNVFFRLYNKTREVIEKNYKSFFFQRWLDERLISNYDFFCLNVAFEAGSYVSGLLKGRIEWYLKYGKNTELKEELRALLTKCYEKSDNLDYIKEKLKGVLPEVTLVTNCEFQCKRKFFTSCDKFMQEHYFEFDGIQELYRLFKILHLRREFMDYLTLDAVCFVEDKQAKEKKLCDWWKRIHTCEIKGYDNKILDLYRTHDRQADKNRARRKLLSSIAYFNILNKNSLEEREFVEDCSDVLSVLNDNDFYGFASSDEGVSPRFFVPDYRGIQVRKARQNKSIIKNLNENEMKEENENESNC